MPDAKVSDKDYIDHLIASPLYISATEAAKVAPVTSDPPAHDAFTRLLHRLEPDAETLWAEAQTQLNLTEGVLVLDDSTLDKPHARVMELVTRHWSGKHKAVVQGINLVTLLWTDGDRAVPCDYRVYDKDDEHTKNDHFAAMLQVAKTRFFQPRCVLFDGWYSSLDNLKLVKSLEWTWLTRLKSNRLVNRDREGLRPLANTDIAASGTEVWLKGYGLVKVFKMVSAHGDIGYWATNDLTMTELDRLKWADASWKIEHYHQGIKQHTGIERCQCRKAIAQRNHIGLAIRAFLRLESHAFHTGYSWMETKKQLLRDAIRAYLDKPKIRLIPSPTA